MLVANATYQWVPGHLDLLPDLVAEVAPGGWFAFQVPGNRDEPRQVLLHQLAADPRFASYTHGVARPHAHDPGVYADALRALGLVVDAWETTYLHLLAGVDPVFTWISGTGARPTLRSLPEPLREEFEAEYAALLREAYPPAHTGPRCRSGGSSWWGRCRDEAAARAGVVPARCFASRPELCARRSLLSSHSDGHSRPRLPGSRSLVRFVLGECPSEWPDPPTERVTAQACTSPPGSPRRGRSPYAWRTPVSRCGGTTTCRATPLLHRGRARQPREPLGYWPVPDTWMVDLRLRKLPSTG